MTDGSIPATSGYRDKDGYFFITGRSKEMIVLSTGKKIFPDELEKFYKQIPSIKEICLIQGERGIEAAVVPDFDYLKKENLSNSRETIAFAIEDLAKDLPPYKRITGLRIFKESLPATRLGKLKRSKIRELYQQGGERTDKTIAGDRQRPAVGPGGRETARLSRAVLREKEDRRLTTILSSTWGSIHSAAWSSS